MKLRLLGMFQSWIGKLNEYDQRD